MPSHRFLPLRTRTLGPLWLAIAGITLVDAAVAQTPPVIQVAPDGAIQIDSNAFDIFTGPNQNDANIPMPAGLILNVQDGVAQPIRLDQLAPNTVNTQIDIDYINQELQSVTPGFQILDQSLQFNGQFNLEYRVGDHGFGEGIQVTVFGPGGVIRSQETVFVRGNDVQIGPAGENLPNNAQINVVYGAQDTLELRILHIETDGANPDESGLYFTTAGNLVVEDLNNGGDLDFDDGNFFEQSSGAGAANIQRTFDFISDRITFRTEVIETPLEPLLREEQVTVEIPGQVQQLFTEVDEARQPGQVEIIEPEPPQLFHATGVTTNNDEQLIYQRYAAAVQARLGSDGASLTGQLPPLVSNPAAFPTLIAGMIAVDPFVDNNEAALTASVGITQFLGSTHRDAVDMYGRPIANPDAEGPRLVLPTGLINNTRLVGYVPPLPPQTIPGEPLSSVNGIFEIPEGQAVMIAPLSPEQVGMGAAGYTQNVGGFIVEKTDGTAAFIPQWAQQEYATEPLTLEAGTVRRVIYALVPQQAGQNLQLGQAYVLSDQGGDGYQIADGGFRVISADRYPGNFRQESGEVYAVEDTLPGQNFANSFFNGFPGNYRQRPAGPLISTVDLTQPDEVDARVGNQLATPDILIPGEPGQDGYFETTLAGGPYVAGALFLGLGNQEDQVTLTTSTFFNQSDVVFRQTTTRLLATPQTQVDTVFSEVITTTQVTTQETGQISFDVAQNGALSNFVPSNITAAEIAVTPLAIRDGDAFIQTTIREGQEFLTGLNTVTSEPIVLASQTDLIDQQVTTGSDTYPNVSPLLGELTIGGVLNFGNTPWTPAANTLRAELFMVGTVMGEGQDSGNTGWRVEAIFNPFGEQQRPAYAYTAAEELVPIYQTQPRLDDAGQPVVTRLKDSGGQEIAVDTYEFVLDEAGDRIPTTVGTGRAIGPGVYLRLQDVFDGDEGLSLQGGLTYNF